MSDQNKYHLHLVSDSTGETLSSISRSVLAQFDVMDIDEHIWSLVRTEGQMDRVIENIEQNPGLVIYTVVDGVLKEKLERKCQELDLPIVPVLSKVIREMSRYFGVKPNKLVGRQYDLDEEYFERIDAINYTLMHDDGQMPEDLDKADIVLVGVSRTSKTPTSVYLSYRGLKVANVPFVKDVHLAEQLFNLPERVFVIGLVISPERLLQIRRSRLDGLNEDRETTYTNPEYVKEEIKEARLLFNKQNWQVIDVTRKSVEEASAQILNLYSKFKNESK